MLRLVYFFTIIMCFIPQFGNCEDKATFFYFAYGSNLLAKRIHIQNPTAVYYSPAKLENYRLDFNMFSMAWNGAPATIVEEDTAELWGTLWTLDVDQIKNLDDQEGVDAGRYFAKNVTVVTPDGRKIIARTYEQTDNPKKLKMGEDIPLERRPSSTYLAVIAFGAVESGLPADYIGSIFTFPTNRQLASTNRRLELGYPF